MRAAWNQFFFREESPAPLALTRVLLCGAMLVPVASRWRHCRTLYSSDGAPAPIWEWWPGTTSLPVPGGGVCVLLYSLLVLCLACGLVGWRTRATLLTAAPLMLWFAMLDVTGTLTKYSVIAFHALLILACSRCGEAYSLDAALSGRPSPTRVEAWPRRLLQLFLCVLYFATALTKIKSPEYLSGEHTLFWMRTEMNFPHPLGVWLSGRPLAVMLSCQLALFWEATFCGLIWVRPVRPLVVALGVAFHAGTALLLGLWVFPLVMLALYPVLADPEAVRRLMDAAAARVPALRLPGRDLAWVAPVVLGLTLAGAVQAERLVGPHGPRPELPPIADGDARRLLSGTPQTAPADWVWDCRLGTTTAGGWAVGPSSGFRPGQTIQLQLCLVRPHADFTVTVRLEDGTGQTVDSATRLVRREQTRWTLPWTLADDARGDYRFVLECDGEVIAQVRFGI